MPKRPRTKDFRAQLLRHLLNYWSCKPKETIFLSAAESEARVVEPIATCAHAMRMSFLDGGNHFNFSRQRQEPLAGW